MSQAAASATGSLPPVISEYLAASDRGDAEAIVRCFAEDAVVVDEGQEWRGTAPIRRWRATVATAYQYTVQVTGRRRWARWMAPNVTTCTSTWKATSPGARLT